MKRINFSQLFKPHKSRVIFKQSNSAHLVYSNIFRKTDAPDPPVVVTNYTLGNGKLAQMVLGKAGA